VLVLIPTTMSLLSVAPDASPLKAPLAVASPAIPPIEAESVSTVLFGAPRLDAAVIGNAEHHGRAVAHAHRAEIDR